MADKTTFIKLDRNILGWRWFKDSKAYHIFSYLLIKANIKDGYFQTEKIERGSLVTSNAHIADDCGLTIQNVRTVLANLEETGEIARKQRNHYQIITVLNYEYYQSDSRNLVGQITVRPNNFDIATNRQLTTIKEYKNKRTKNKEKVKKESPSPFPPDGGGDVPKASRMKPKDEGTVDDIPAEVRDMFETYKDYWEFRNR